jgi:SAM-dependent methyltransferase
MSMVYALENKNESERLERQSLQSAYQLEEELKAIRLTSPQRILDAGCGTGLVARALAEKFPQAKVEGFDYSQERLEYAKSLAQTDRQANIHYFSGSLESIPAGNETYDLITCRYVFEHLTDPLKVLQEFHRLLKPNGQVHIINFDGLFFNLYPLSKELNTLLETIKNKAPADLMVGRKIPSLMKQAGFKEAHWSVTAHGFSDEKLVQEQKMNEERLGFAVPLLAQVFGSETQAQRFKKLYIEEMMQPGSTLFYNKFIVQGVK